ncbi:metal-sensitive transcriptional regulator [Deferribacterales bacterium Es71-Z0220]|uniref:metal-sensitive transcriptional regulator n=1 Tax=Deferrivibrio essentukiensis TaxID=2880922 RepID=UPI001F6255F2|nr:metal-sensitive transcriptional regulator [Deferrivibrio essentukiensis]MCB4204015.1 metal-sensitive transcriptional regulator [Deferrivibrio essentukiensis]
MFDDKIKKDVQTRLAKIEGQIRGISNMVADEKYCIDIINQITATRRALDKVAMIILKKHINSCVAKAIKSDNSEDIVNELISVIDKYIK